MDKEKVDVVVVGAGAVGLSVARAFAMGGREVIVLEHEEAIGTQTSSRNSEVIHAGFYYPAGSLKAQLCVRGKELLYDFCREHKVTYNQCEKLVVATTKDEVGILPALVEKGRVNNVLDLEILNAKETRALEPHLSCFGALRSPSTGIFDSHGFMLAMEGDIEARGGAIALRAPAIGGEVFDGGVHVHVGGAAPLTLSANLVVNSAGLWATEFAHQIKGLSKEHIPTQNYARGNYFVLSGAAPFSHLIYPVPQPAGLGLHYTRDLGGQGRFGPDVDWIDAIDYRVNTERLAMFYKAVRRYWPDLEDGALHPSYAGVRPKLQSPGEPVHDFVIQGAGTHRIEGLVNLFGIESPGLTSSLAIGDYVAAMVNS